MAYVIGLMSGTSLDGVDVALVDIQGHGISTQIKLVDFLTLPFDSAIKHQIQEVLSLETSDVQKICSLNARLGYTFAKGAKTICDKNNLQPADIKAIGSHGQTIWHQPQAEGMFVPSTLQIGEPAVIAFETGIQVVSNFRTMDMAAGGQGAPLVPYTEWLLYRSDSHSRLLQNIGGIGNVTVMPKGCQLAQVTAFDTGPGNMIIDGLCQQLFGVDYDKDGALAAKGHINTALLDACMTHPYLQQTPPKSTGRELFGASYVNQLMADYGHLDKHDLLATMVLFTAKTIEQSYRQFVFPHQSIDQVVVSGGGSYNRTLMRMLQDLLADTCQVLTCEDLGYSSEAKEAVAFAILANETLHQQPSNVPSVTGASRPVVLGSITQAPRV